MNLSDLPKRLFQGIMPSLIATCDDRGIPNVTYLSQVFFIDEKRVALSCQFFNKTKANVLVSPVATLLINDPTTLEGYRLVVRYDHEESQGPLFETMSRRIDAIASHTGMAGIFKLRSADVYEVLEVDRVPQIDPPAPDDEPPPPQTPAFRSELNGLQLVAQRMGRAKDLESLLATTLETLETAFGFEHSMVLLLDETGQRLFAIASHGYGEGGIGAEVGVGEGLIGTVARERCVLRVAGVGADLRYGRAIRASVHRAGGAKTLAPEIPLPGLVDAQSQLALPLVAGDRLVGVIAVESRSAGMFEEWHEAYLEIVAAQVAFAIENMVRRERDAETTEVPPAPQGSHVVAPSARTRRFKFFRSDDCVFVDDEYLIRNLPGRILWKILRTHLATGRTEFTNRELRLDPALGLPAIRDNLESRLVLLRKRLAQKCSDIALVSIGRGQFRLDVGGPIRLEDEGA
jgi:adenylate cyclase